MFKKLLLTSILLTLIPFVTFAQGKIERPSTSNKTSSMTGIRNGHQYVDLGLPSGTKWATCNVGTENFDYYGNFFVWGNPIIITNDNVSWNERPKYYDQNSFAGLKEYDPATAIWGGKWRTPTKEEFVELMDNCTFTWTDDYDGGVWVQSKRNGQKIYLPACGGCSGTQGYDYIGILGLYWTSTYAPSHESSYGDEVKDFAYCFSFSKDESVTETIKFYDEPRQACLSIRPVISR